MKWVFTVCILTYTNAIFCQDISGRWMGNYGKSLFDADVNKLVVDIELYNDSLIKGTSHLHYGNNHYEYYAINGFYRKADSTIYFSEDREIAVNLGMMATNTMGNYTMKLKVTGETMRLEGKWRENGDKLLSVMATRVWLEKGPKKDTVAILPSVPPSPIKPEVIAQSQEKTIKEAERETIIQREIEIDTIEQDSIRIDIVDNAKIDNDVISLYLDDSLLIHKATISKDPITFYLYLDSRHTYRNIRLVAESYGSMPPCTAHMKVTTCQSLHRFDLRSTYQSDAVVEFYLKGTRDANPTTR